MVKRVKKIWEILCCWYWYVRENNKRSELAKDRLETCMSCHYLDKGTNKNKIIQFIFKQAWRCDKCGCYIFAKVYTEDLKCDMSFWDE